jgi:XapX domain-containing protein
MKLYALSLGAGLLVGLIYSLLDVRSPAPPLVALVGLLGILVGEQIIPVGKQLLVGTGFVTACDKTQAVNHVFGQLPGRQQGAQQAHPAQEKQS